MLVVPGLPQASPLRIETGGVRRRSRDVADVALGVRQQVVDVRCTHTVGFLLGAALCLGALVAFAGGSQAQSGVLLDTERTSMLVRNAQIAHYIVVGTIQDTSYFQLNQDRIATEYQVRIDEYLKGSPHPDSTLSFIQAGGVIGARSQTMSTAYDFRIGESYLLFLGDCENHDRWKLWCLARDLVAHIDGDSALFRWRDAVPTSAVLDSTRAVVESNSLASVFSSADIVVRGTITAFQNANPGAPSYDHGVLSIAVDSVLVDRASLGTPPTVSARVLRTKGGGAVVGATPMILDDGEAIVSLVSTPEGWQLVPSVNAVLSESQGGYEARGYSFKCRGSVAVQSYTHEEVQEAMN